jgi:hypothetical protein
MFFEAFGTPLQRETFVTFRRADSLSTILHSVGQKVYRAPYQPHISVVLTFLDEHRREGDDGLSQREGILKLKFSYLVYEKRQASGRCSKFNFGHRVSQTRDPIKRAIWRCAMEGACLCALKTGVCVLGLGNTGATPAPRVQADLHPLVGEEYRLPYKTPRIRYAQLR